MMKRFASMLLALALCTMLAVGAHAAELPRLFDGADLLTYEQETALLSRLDAASAALQADLVIVTLDSCGEYSPDLMVEAFYDEYGYGYGEGRDGAMLLVSMEERDYRILSNGFAADAITQDEIYDIGDDVAAYLSDGDYEGAFAEFIERCVYEIDGERNGFPFPFGLSLGVSVAIGFVVAFVVTGIMRMQLKSVRSRSEAKEYTVSGSMHLTRSSDLFLYRTLDRRAKPKESSSGSRSGGGGRNVGGGKF